MTAMESTRISGQEGIATSVEVTAWEGPFTERDRYGEYTGASYVRCADCGIEVVVGDTDRAAHREGCQQA